MFLSLTQTSTEVLEQVPLNCKTFEIGMGVCLLMLLYINVGLLFCSLV